MWLVRNSEGRIFHVRHTRMKNERYKFYFA